MKHRIVRRLITWVLVLGVLAALIIFVVLPMLKPAKTEELPAPVILSGEAGKKAITMENDDLLFEMEPDTSRFKVTDKATGEVWYSNPADADSDPIALSAAKDNMKSTLIVSYQTKSGPLEFNNSKYSIENGNFEIRRTEEGAVEVEYTVGKVEKVFLIPVATTVERFDAFIQAMGSKNAKKVKSNYTLYDPAKLDGKDNKDEILAYYPEVANQPMYILKSDTKEKNKKSLEEYFAAGGYNAEEYATDLAFVAGASENTSALFNVTMVYRLEGRELVVEVPYERIRYREDYPITYISVLPGFGAAGTDATGSMLVPEGGGALIRCNNGKQSQSGFYVNIYGWDWGTNRDEVVNETRAEFPVFGMLDENASFMCTIEQGASYASVLADTAGRVNSYNTLYAKFVVLHTDQYNVSAKTAQMVYMSESAIPDTTVRQRYSFMTGGSYVEMAQLYGSHLSRNESFSASQASAETPVLVDLVGAIDKTVVKLGLPVDSVVATTTFAQAQQIMNKLLEDGVKGLNLRMTGWANGGVQQKVLSSVRTLWELGGEQGLKSLIKAAADKNVPLYFDGISCFAYNSGLFDGFIAFRDAARLTTREQIKVYPYDLVTYQQGDWLDAFYLVKPSYAAEKAANLSTFLWKMGAAGISYRDIGYLLSGDYNPSSTTTRETTLAMNVQTLRDAGADGTKVAVYGGNDYAMAEADLITDMSLEGQKYSLLDEMIPFYQIAIHGTKDYVGTSVNMAGDYKKAILECAEYGAGLSFTFIDRDPFVLQDTLYSRYFGTSFSEWEEKAVALITRYQSETEGLNRQKITGHRRLSDDVTVTEYADGTRVYVNYGTGAYNGDGVTVPAEDYLVAKGGK